MVTDSVRTRRSSLSLAAGALALVMVLAGCGGGSDEEAAASAAPAGSAAATPGQEVLLDAQQLTVLDQQIVYPKKKPARVSSSIVQLEPGQETGWQKHNTPMFAYVLEGTVSVEYDAGVTKEFSAGTALMEAVDVWYNAVNKGEQPVRILVVSMGAKGAKDTVQRAP